MNRMMNCKYCDKIAKNNGGLVMHELSCVLNPQRIRRVRSPLAGAKKGCETWNKGKKFVDLLGEEKAAVIRKKKSASFTPPCLNLTEEQEINRRNKIRKHAIKTGLGGYVQGSGRGKKGWYKGYWCDSSWELAYVVYNIEHDISFTRNTEGFEYMYKDKKRKWYPDFIIDNEYFEVKGYVTAQVEAKCESFPHTLHMVGKNEIKKYLEYAKSKYGKNFIEIYE